MRKLLFRVNIFARIKALEEQIESLEETIYVLHNNIEERVESLEEYDIEDLEERINNLEANVDDVDCNDVEYRLSKVEDKIDEVDVDKLAELEEGINELQEIVENFQQGRTDKRVDALFTGLKQIIDNL